MSGGPLVNSRGELVGLDTFIPGGERTEAGPWNALPSNYIKRRLAELRPGGAHFFVGWEREHMRCHHALRELSNAVMKSHPGTAQQAQAGGGTTHRGALESAHGAKRGALRRPRDVARTRMGW